MEIKFRMWIEKDGEHVIGKGGAEILRAIRDEGSISSASRKLGMSYKYIWSYLKKMESVVGKVVETTKGGKGGGRTRLTRKGEEILAIYDSCENVFHVIAEDRFLVMERGRLRGKTVEIPGEVAGEEEVIVLRKKSSEEL